MALRKRIGYIERVSAYIMSRYHGIQLMILYAVSINLLMHSSISCFDFRMTGLWGQLVGMKY
jgi:hypothetical protein